MKKLFPYISAILLLFICAGCAKPAPAQRDFLAMDTFVSLTAYGANAAQAVNEAAETTVRLENLISATHTTSEIYIANNSAAKQFTVSTQTADILRTALAMCARTNGNMDISLYPVVTAWGFTQAVHSVPDRAALDTLLQHVDYRKITVDANTLHLPHPMMIDLGSIAKGYIADVCADIMAAHGVTSALLDFGGDLLAIGAKPDGTDWRIAVQDPLDESAKLGIVSLRDKAIVTSGGYARFFAQNGEIYWHIIDPKTGTPARNGLISVTVIGETGTLCDGLSTALFVMGKEAAIAHHALYNDFDMILVTDENEVIITPNLRDSFTLLHTDIYRLAVIGE